MILDKFFLKYEGGRGVKLTPPPEKTTLKKPSVIRVKTSVPSHNVNKCISEMLVVPS